MWQNSRRRLRREQSCDNLNLTAADFVSVAGIAGLGLLELLVGEAVPPLVLDDDALGVTVLQVKCRQGFTSSRPPTAK